MLAQSVARAAHQEWRSPIQSFRPSFVLAKRLPAPPGPYTVP
jgi:hypothetical protein